jgi:hypothetical protein
LGRMIRENVTGRALSKNQNKSKESTTFSFKVGS